MKSRRFNYLVVATCLIALQFCVLSSHAGNSRTQIIALHKGWNSVFLQVTPSNTSPAAVFTNLPVTIAATFLAADRKVEFIQNPGSIPWSKDGWGVWYSSSRPDGFLSSLHAIHGNCSYLIYAKQDV